MDNQNNIGNQNTIQKEQDQIGQLLQIPKKSRINYFALLIVPVIVLIVFLTTTLAPFFLRKNNSSQTVSECMTIPWIEAIYFKHPLISLFYYDSRLGRHNYFIFRHNFEKLIFN